MCVSNSIVKIESDYAFCGDEVQLFSLFLKLNSQVNCLDNQNVKKDVLIAIADTLQIVTKKQTELIVMSM